MGLLVTLFFFSLGTYPVVEARIVSLPLPAFFLGILLWSSLTLGLAGHRIVIDTQDYKLIAAASVLGVWLLAVTAASSMAFGYGVAPHRYVGIGYILVFPALALILGQFRTLYLLWALLGGCVVALAIGYGRFITVSGGVSAEHALGYWGIKYLPSTRNSDVIYPLVSSLLATGLYTITRARLTRYLLILIILASFVAVTLSLSRSAWIALASGFVALLWSTRGQTAVVRARGAAIGLLVIAAMLGATWLLYSSEHTVYGVVLDRMQSIFDANDPRVSNRERLDIASNAIAGILEHPAGLGVGNCHLALGPSAVPGQHAENAWLSLGLEGGWPAIVAFSLIMLWLALPNDSIPESRNSGYHSVPSATGTALVVAISSYLMFNYELDSLFLWSVLSVVWAVKRRRLIASNHQYFRADGGVQRSNDNRGCVTFGSGADASAGRNSHCR